LFSSVVRINSNYDFLN